MSEFRNNGRYGSNLEAMFPGRPHDNDYLCNKAEVEG